MKTYPTPPKNGWIYIDHDGTLFRGFSRSHPQEVWGERTKAWRSYAFEGEFKAVDWGMVISEAERPVRTRGQTRAGTSADPAQASSPAVTAQPRQTRTVPVDIQGVTDVGATVRVKNVDLAEDATIVDVSISFGGDRTNNVQMASSPTYIELPNGQKLMLKVPEGNSNMNIVKGDTMNGRLVSMGAVLRDARQISLVFNEGSSSDSIIGPFLRLTIPLTAQAAGAPG